MIEILKSIWEFISAIGDFIFMTIKSLIEALLFLPNMISSLTESVVYLPSVLSIFATLFITLMIINYIVGRNG